MQDEGGEWIELLNTGDPVDLNGLSIGDAGTGWSTWDDDPAFDAPVSGTQSRSAPNSIEVKDDSEFSRGEITHAGDSSEHRRWCDRFSEKMSSGVP